MAGTYITRQILSSLLHYIQRFTGIICDYFNLTIKIPKILNSWGLSKRKDSWFQYRMKPARIPKTTAQENSQSMTKTQKRKLLESSSDVVGQLLRNYSRAGQQIHYISKSKLSSTLFLNLWWCWSAPEKLVELDSIFTASVSQNYLDLCF